MTPPPLPSRPAKGPLASAYWPNPVGGPGHPKPAEPPAPPVARLLCHHLRDALEGLGGGSGKFRSDNLAAMVLELLVRALVVLLRFGVKFAGVKIPCAVR